VVLGIQGVVLELVKGPAFMAAAFQQEKPGELQVFALSGDPVQLGEPHFHDLVPRNVPSPVRPEGAEEELGAFECDLQERPLARGRIVGRRGLVQVAAVVELVALHQAGPALLAREGVRVRRIDGPVREEVPVLFLGRGDESDEPVQLPVQLPVVVLGEGVGRPLDGLVQVGVVPRMRADVGPLHEARGLAEIVHPAVTARTGRARRGW
jgi:hypothetical protein